MVQYRILKCTSKFFNKNNSILLRNSHFLRKMNDEQIKWLCLKNSEGSIFGVIALFNLRHYGFEVSTIIV